MQRNVNRFPRTAPPVRPLNEQATHALERLQANLEQTQVKYDGLEFWRRNLERITNAIPKADEQHPQELLRDRLFRITTAVQGLQYLLLARGTDPTPHPLDPAIHASRGALRCMADGALNHASAWRERLLKREASHA